MTQRPEKTTQSAARTHPDERGRIAALNSVGLALRGALPDKPEISYYTPELIQCTLPHSDPKTPHWKKTNGDFTLIVSSGVDENLKPYGIPYGSFPRLVLAHIITQVIKSGEQRVEFGKYFSSFLEDIGYTSNHRGTGVKGERIREQFMRLIMARIAFQQQGEIGEEGYIVGGNVNVANRYALWWNFKNPEQGSFFGSFIDLSEDFYAAILRAPVPLRTDVLKALKRSPLALDVYMWVSYRLFTMQANGQEQVTLGYGRLQEQFGTGISEANYRSFRRDFKAALAKVKKYWVSPDGAKELLNYELHEEGMTLFRSPLLIGTPKRKVAEKAAEEEAAQIVASRRFDDITLKQARQAAGTQWDVHWLASQYFEWIAREGITPKVPRAHFLNFIKEHRKRNEK